MTIFWVAIFLAGVALIVWGAETFAEHLGVASVRLGVSAFAMALLLAGAEPEELATVISASLKGAPGIALGDAIGANIAICLVALGVGAIVAPIPFRGAVMRYAALGLPIGAIAAWIAAVVGAEFQRLQQAVASAERALALARDQALLADMKQIASDLDRRLLDTIGEISDVAKRLGMNLSPWHPSVGMATAVRRLGHEKRPKSAEGRKAA